MIKLNSQSINKAKNQKQINFTFANAKIKSKTIESNASELTSSQKRALGMWLETVLQGHSEEFIHALKSCRKYSISAIGSYIKRHYSHLKIIAQYYIIASLLDYQHILPQSQTEVNVQKECVFTNIVIQELTSRFFRESQWLHKIGYVPIFALFPLFDSFSKGYTTINQLRNTLRRVLVAKSTDKHKIAAKQKFQRKKERLLFLKFTNNIDGKDNKIYQQNLQQLMFRVNLVIFEEKSQMGSQRYLTIKKVLDHHQKLTTQRYQRNVQEEILKDIKQKQELQILRENFQITFKSNIMTRSNDQTQNKLSATKKEEKIPESVFSTMPYSTGTATRYQNVERSSRNQDLIKYSHYGQSRGINQQEHQRISRKAREQEIQRRLIQQAQQEMKQNLTVHENLLHEQFISKNLRQIQKNKKNLELKNSILKQLQIIREEKKSNHCRLLNYI